jgi:hypothetical protein
LSSPHIATYLTESDSSVGIEIDPVDGFALASTDLTPSRVREAIGPAIEAAQTVLERVRDIAPEQVQVKFGVKVTGTANWLIAKAATEGNFEVTLIWQRDDSEQEREK